MSELCNRAAGNARWSPVGHIMLITAWHMLSNHIDYKDLGPDHFRIAQTPPNRPAASSTNSSNSATKPPQQQSADV
ncbi:hypothetical protein [Asanoa siamensis]|uniref:hypothetical protein n=1 Tax=Asanoa siamensis TaxID=926357 RepID=UPI001942D907|nr:hypothetical protein [Asanoa siamensis]